MTIGQVRKKTSMPGSVAMFDGLAVLIGYARCCGDALSDTVRRIRQDPESGLLVSVASQIEVAIKNQIGKLRFSQKDLSLVCRNADINLYPIRSRHADQLFEMQFNHCDRA